MSRKINWDALGISASLACAIHCAILPLLISSLPILGINIINNMAFELSMILLALVIGSYTLWHGYTKHHHSILPLILFVMGMSFLFAKQIWHYYELWLLPFAVLFIVSAHLLNLRYCRVPNAPAGKDHTQYP